MIQREISRVLVLNLSGKASGADAPPGRTMPLTEPSLLSRGTLMPSPELEFLTTKGRPTALRMWATCPGLRRQFKHSTAAACVASRATLGSSAVEVTLGITSQSAKGKLAIGPAGEIE